MSSRPYCARVVGLISVASVAVAGCAGAERTRADEETAGQAEDALRTSYGELAVTLQDAELDRWFAVRRSLIDGFDRICGDTICSGDFSNLTTLELSCSSTSVAKKMKDCTWVLGGSIGYVDGRTGAFTTEARVFDCHVAVSGSARALLDTLEGAGADALHTPLANGTSFYDGLTKCFEGVVGSPPPAETGTTWRDFEDYLWEADGDQAIQWLDVRRKLARSFDDVCGDTFCEGDYPDIGLVDVSCSVRASTGRVKACRLTFGKVSSMVNARGAFSSETATTTCDVPINASRAALMTALSGDDPLRATLPGRNTSIYDALIDCL